MHYSLKQFKIAILIFSLTKWFVDSTSPSSAHKILERNMHQNLTCYAVVTNNLKIPVT